MRRLAIGIFLACGTACADENPAPLCYKNLASEARFASIASKLPLADLRDISFENLANKAMPTAKERKLIADWVEARKPCFQIGIEHAKTTLPPQVSSLVIEADNNLTVVLASLFNKEISYGTANKKIQALADDMRNRITNVADQSRRENAAIDGAIAEAKSRRDANEQNRRDSEARYEEQRRANIEMQMQQQQAQADAERRQAAMQMLNNFKPYQMPNPYQMPIRPTVNTNCTQYGNQTSCTTR